MKKDKSNLDVLMETSFSSNIVPPKEVIMSMLAEKKKDLAASNLLMELTAVTM